MLSIFYLVFTCIHACLQLPDECRHWCKHFPKSWLNAPFLNFGCRRSMIVGLSSMCLSQPFCYRSVGATDTLLQQNCLLDVMLEEVVPSLKNEAVLCRAISRGQSAREAARRQAGNESKCARLGDWNLILFKSNFGSSSLCLVILGLTLPFAPVIIQWSLQICLM